MEWNGNKPFQMSECVSADSKITQVVQQEIPHRRASRRESSSGDA